MLLIDQHVAHERILFDKYRALESTRTAESQQLLIPETFDLTPAQAAVFDFVSQELESYGFDLMRLSGRTVAIKATPADLPANEARNMLAEILDTVDAEKKGTARETLRDEIAASLACHAAIKVNMPLAPEKMRWLIDRLLLTSSPTPCPHGRPVILRLTTHDIQRLSPDLIDYREAVATSSQRCRSAATLGWAVKVGCNPIGVAAEFGFDDPGTATANLGWRLQRFAVLTLEWLRPSWIRRQLLRQLLDDLLRAGGVANSGLSLSLLIRASLRLVTSSVEPLRDYRRGCFLRIHLDRGLQNCHGLVHMPTPAS